jgi:hypothetical protein
MHDAHAQRSRVAAPADAEVDTHLIAFVLHAGELWQLDGRRGHPISHGPAEGIERALAVVREEFLPHITDKFRIALNAVGIDD